MSDPSPLILLCIHCGLDAERAKRGRDYERGHASYFAPSWAVNNYFFLLFMFSLNSRLVTYLFLMLSTEKTFRVKDDAAARSCAIFFQGLVAPMASVKQDDSPVGVAEEVYVSVIAYAAEVSVPRAALASMSTSQRK